MEFRTPIDRADEGTYVVAPSGDLDAYTAPNLRHELTRLVETGSVQTLVIDLSGVTFLDSTALGTLISSLRRMREIDGELRIVQPRPVIARIFSLTGLDRVLSLYESRAEALER